MDPDDILRMAREADRWATNQTSDTYEWKLLRDERFAALVAAAEREECTKACEYREMYGDLIETLRDCANALDELLPSDHAYRKIVEQANRLIDRHDCRTTHQAQPKRRPYNASASLSEYGIFPECDAAAAFKETM